MRIPMSVDSDPRAAATGPRVAAVLAAAWLAAGCELRDEPVRPEAAARGWPAATIEAAEREGGPPRTPAGDGGDYVEGYAAGARRAAAEGLPMLLVFKASWCRWSGEAIRGPLADAAIEARSRRFVGVRVDADRDADTCREFAVKAFPTVVVVDADGHERFRESGSPSVGRLAAALDGLAPATSRPDSVADGPRPSAASGGSRDARAAGGDLLR